MQAAQEFNFHLASGDVIFSQIFQHHDGSFFANVTGTIPPTRFGESRWHMWLPCPSKATAVDAFKEILKYAGALAQQAGTTLRSINNPCNDEFVKEFTQNQLAGGIAITINDPV